ncbi:MAG: YciI family protein [Pseudomonadota bacterium]
MPKYVFAYHGGKAPESPEEGAEVMAKWNSWFETMGDAVVDGGNPVGPSKTVSAGGVAEDGGANPLSGYSIVQADTMDAAVEMAKGCPIMDHGSVEVAEAMDM